MLVEYECLKKGKTKVGFDTEPEDQAGFRKELENSMKNSNTAKQKRYWSLPDPLRMFTGRSGEFSLGYNRDEID